MTIFRYAPVVAERFPAVVGGVIHATGLRNGPAPGPLAAAFVEEQAAAIGRVGATPLSEVPALAAWRRAFRAFGVDPTQYRSAAEALLRRLTKGGALPAINALVDLANLVSIRYALPVAVFDLARVAGGALTVTVAAGTESWADIGASETDHAARGEVVFLDDEHVVHARRWCWRQSAASAARDDTTDVLVTVEGHHEAAVEDVARAMADLEDLLGRFGSPSGVRLGVVTAREPSFA